MLYLIIPRKRAELLKLPSPHSCSGKDCYPDGYMPRCGTGEQGYSPGVVPESRSIAQVVYIPGWDIAQVVYIPGWDIAQVLPCTLHSGGYTPALRFSVCIPCSPPLCVCTRRVHVKVRYTTRMCSVAALPYPHSVLYSSFEESHLAG